MPGARGGGGGRSCGTLRGVRPINLDGKTIVGGGAGLAAGEGRVDPREYMKSRGLDSYCNVVSDALTKCLKNGYKCKFIKKVFEEDCASAKRGA